MKISRPIRRRFARCKTWAVVLLQIGLMLFHTTLASANPLAPTVVSGSATIHQHSPNLTHIHQSSNRAIINWKDFSIGAGQTTQFIQPSSSAAILNRVTGNNASAILGSLQSNGNVFLINPNGILFGQNSQINVGGLVASTLDINNSQFMRGGDLTFSGNSNASVINRGQIRAVSGDIYLIGQNVQNHGLMQAPYGTVGLGAGSEVQLVDGGHKSLIVRAGGGGVLNTGTIEAVRAELAANGGNVFGLAVNNQGVIRATGGVNVNGEIYLTANGGVISNTGSLIARNANGNGGRVVIDAGLGGTANIGGYTDVSGAKGGTVHFFGENVNLSGSLVDASGTNGGGEVLVGGDFQGNNPNINNAKLVNVDDKTTIKANATTNGNGGKVIVWSDDTTNFEGSIAAKGGSESGDGGFAEVSGKIQLHYSGLGDLSAARGQTGTILLDPTNFTTDFATIAGTLSGANVVISTSGAGAQDGDITVNASGTTSLTTNNSLAFLAHGDVIFNGSVQLDGTGSLSVVAGWDGITETPGGSGINSPATINFANITANMNSYGQAKLNGGNGSVRIGNAAQTDGIAVGSRFGATNVAAFDLTLLGSNNILLTDGYAQLGYRANVATDATGALSVDLINDLNLTGGSEAGTYAQVGHGGIDFGGPALSGNFRSDISVNVGGNVAFTGGGGASAYAQLGHGGDNADGTGGDPGHRGSITLNNANNLSLLGGGGNNSYAQIGHGGVNSDGGHGTSVLSGDDGFIQIAVNGNLDLVGGGGTNTYAQIGHGDASSNSSGTRVGSIDLTVSGESSLVNGGGTAPWLIGHQTTSGAGSIFNSDVTFVTNTLDNTTFGSTLMTSLNGDFASKMVNNLAGGHVTIGSTNTLAGPVGGVTVTGNFDDPSFPGPYTLAHEGPFYDSPNNLSILSSADLVFNASVQNHGSGQVNIVAGWDGTTGLNVTPDLPLDMSLILANDASYGVNVNNGGVIYIGDHTIGAGIAVGSRLSETNAAGGSMVIRGSDVPDPAGNPILKRFSQLGYNAVNRSPPSSTSLNRIDITGDITVRLDDPNGGLTMRGGDDFYAFAQIGHGDAIGDTTISGTGLRTGDIDVQVAGETNLFNGGPTQGIWRIGHNTRGLIRLADVKLVTGRLDFDDEIFNNADVTLDFAQGALFADRFLEDNIPGGSVHLEETNSPGGILLDSLGTISFNTENDLTLISNSGGIVFSNSTVINNNNNTVGSLFLTAVDGVTQSDNSSLRFSNMLFNGTGTFDLPGGNNAVLNLAANIDGSFTFNDVNDLEIGTVSGTNGITLINGNLELTAAGDITQTQAVSVAGIGNMAQFTTTGNNNDITLDDLAIVGMIGLGTTGGGSDATITNATAIDFKTTSVGGNLAATATTGGFTQTGGAMSVGGSSTFVVNDGESIILGDATNAFTGALAFTPVSGMIDNLTIFDTTAVALTDIDITGDLNVQANNISLTNTTTVGGMAQFTDTGGNNITLNQLAVTGMLGFSTTGTGNVTFTNATAIDFKLTDVGGSLDATATLGNITDDAGVTVGGMAQFTTLEADATIDLDLLAVTGQIGLSTNGTAANATIVNALGIDFKTTSVDGNLMATATTGDITQTGGSLSIDGDSTFKVSDGQSIILDNAANEFGGPVMTMPISGSINGLTLFSNSAVVLTDIDITGDLNVQADGISQTNTTTVGGMAQFTDIGGNDITLNQLAVTGMLGFSTTGNVTFTNATAIDFKTTNVGGDLDATATAGNITDAASVTVGGMAQFTTSAASATIDLDLLAVTGMIGLSTTGAAADATIINTAAIDFKTTGVGGNLTATASTGDITQTGGLLNVAGNSSFTVNNGQSIVLDDPNNVLTGTLAFTPASGSINNLFIYDTTAVALTDIDVTGDLDVQADGISLTNTTTVGGMAQFTDIGGSDITLNDLAVTGMLGFSTTGNATFTNATAIDLKLTDVGGDLDATATTGNISDDADVIVGGMAQFTTSEANATINLDLLAATGMIGLDTNGGNATIINASAIDFKLTDVGGDLDATATTGNISDDADVIVGGMAQFTTLDSNATIDLGSLAVTGMIGLSTTGATANATIVNTSAIDFKASSVGGDLSATATTGDITQVGGSLNVTGNSTFQVANSESIILNDPTNVFTGSLTFLSAMGNIDDLSVFDTTAVALSNIDITGDLDVQADGISQTNQVVVGGMAQFTDIDGNDITLNDLAVTDMLGFSTTGSVSFTNATAVDFKTTNVGGDLIATATTGNITDAAGVTVGGMAQFTTDAANADIDLDQLAVTGMIGLDTNGGTANATIINATAIDFKTTNVGGDLAATATTGDITQVGGLLTVGGDSSFSVDNGQSIVLENPANTFTGLLAFTALSGAIDDLTIFDTTAVALSNINITGDLDVQANGISQSSTTTVGGMAQFTDTGGNDIVLDELAVTGMLGFSTTGNVTFTNATAIDFKQTNVGGLVATATTGNITDAADVTVTGMAQFTTLQNNASINLNQLGVTGMIGLTTAGGTADASIVNATAIDFKLSNVGRNLSATASTGGITQAGGRLTVGGASTFRVLNGQSIILDNPNNVFTGSLAFTPLGGTINDLTIFDSTAVALTDINIMGDLNVQADGITQTTQVTVGGMAQFTDIGGNSITLNQLAVTGMIGLSSTANVDITNATAIDFKQTTAGGNLSASATTGSITQTGLLTVGGNSTFRVSNGESIILGNPVNTFTGSLDFLPLSGLIDNLTVNDVTAVALGSLNITGDLNVQANGISQTVQVSVGGMAQFTETGINDIILNDLVVTGMVGFSAIGNVTFTNAIAIDFKATTLGGNLDATATTGNIIDSAAVNVGGMAQFTTLQNNADIDLNLLSVTDMIGLSTTGTSANATIVNATAIDFKTTNVGGDLMVTATTGGITQIGGPLNIGGDSTFKVGNGESIILDDPANVFGGTISFMPTAGSIDDLSIFSNSAVVLSDILIGGDLNVQANGISQTNLVTVGGMAQFTDIGGNDITLNQLAVTGMLGFTTTGNATFTNATAIDFKLTDVGGDLDATATTGNITDFETVTVGGMAQFTALETDAIIDLDLLAVTGQIGLSTTGAMANATITNATGIDFKTTDVDGDLMATASTGDITQTGGSLNVSGNSTFSVDNAQSIILNDPTNVFDGTLAFTPLSGSINGLTIFDSTAVALTDIDITGDLDIQADGISLTNTTTVGGMAQFTDIGGNDITLNDLAVTGMLGFSTTGNVTFTNATAVDFKLTDVGGDLAATASNGDITQLGGSLNVGGNSTFSVDDGQSIILNDPTNVFTGTFAVTPISGAIENLTVADSTALALTDINIDGDLDVQADGISQTNQIVVGGMAQFTDIDGNDITLNDLAVTGMLGFTTTGSVSFTNATAVDFKTTNVGDDLVAIATTGDMTDSGSVTVGGMAQFTTLEANADIDLDLLAVTGQIGLSTTGALGNATIINATGIDFKTTNVGGDLFAQATTGDITQTGGPLDIGGDAIFKVDNGQSIILNDPNNMFGGSLMLMPISGSLADLTIFSNSPVVLTDIDITGDLNVQANGGITQSNTTTVGGMAQFTDIGAGDITLNQLAVTGMLGFTTAGNVVFTNATAIDFKATDVGGNLTATATTGNITDAAGVTVNGMAQFTTSETNATIDLNSLDVTGLIGLSTTGASADASIVNTTAIDFKTTNVGGNLLASATTGGITQTGGLLTVGGSSTFRVSNGQSIILDNPTNVFTGALAFTPLSGLVNNLTIFDSTAVDLTSINITGDLDVQANGITQTAPVIVGGMAQFTDIGGSDITLNQLVVTGMIGFTTNGNATFTNATAVDFKTTSVGGNLSASALSGSITQAGGLLTVGGSSTFQVSNAQSIILDNPANTFTGSLNFSPLSGLINNITAFDVTDVALTNINITGDLNIQANGITQTSQVTVGGMAQFTDTGGNNITLNQLAVTGMLGFTTTGDATFTNASAIDFKATDVGGNLDATATTGDITDAAAVNVGGMAQFTTVATNATIDLDLLAATGQIGLSTNGSMGDATIINATAIDFKTTNVGGNLDATATTGGITQTGGTLTVGGTSSFVSGDLSAIVLDDIANDFVGTIVLAQGGSVAMSDANDLILGLIDGTGGLVELIATDAIFEDLDDSLMPNKDILANQALLISGTGIGTDANPLETLISGLEADGGTGGVFIDNMGNLEIGNVNGLTGVTATDAVRIRTTMLGPQMGDILVSEAVLGNGVRLQATGGIIVNDTVTSSDIGSIDLLAGKDVDINANVLNSFGTMIGTGGAVNVVAGWDGTTGVTSAVNFPLIAATVGAFGNNMGSVTIGDGAQAAGISVGSRFGSTNVAAHDLTLQGSNTNGGAFSLLGFRADSAMLNFDIDSPITVAVTNNLTANAGNTVSAYAQLGHGGHLTNGNYNGTITVDAGGNISFNGGNSTNSYAQLGHGGLAVNGNLSSAIIVNAAGNLNFSAGTGFDSYSQLGHGGINMAGSIGGMINVTANNVNFSGGSINWNTYAQLGHGGDGATGNFGGDITVAASGDLNFVAGSIDDGYAKLGHGGDDSIGDLSGDINVSANNVFFTAGSASEAFAQLGHGGSDPMGNLSGAITVNAVGDVTFAGGSGGETFAQLGHGGEGAVGGHIGNHTGNITVNADGDLDLVGGTGDFSYAQIGHGDASGNSSGTRMGNIEVRVAGETSLVNGNGINAPWLIGHRSTGGGISNAYVTLITNTLDYDETVGSTFSLLDQDFADKMIANLAGGPVTIGSTNNTVQGPTGGMVVEGNFVYGSSNNLSLLSGIDVLFNGSVQNSSTGQVNVVAGWDTATGGSPLIIGNIVSNPASYGNNDGSVFIGDGTQTSGIAVGSRSGSTNVAAYGLNVQSSNVNGGFAQLGYRDAAGGTGAINVDLVSFFNTLVETNDSFAQLGHGQSTGNGDIFVTSAFDFDAPFSFSALASRNVTYDASVQNSTAGDVNTVAGWDGVTGIAGTYMPIAIGDILTNPASFANNTGLVTIGSGSQTTGIAVGSRFGETNVAGYGLTVESSNVNGGFAQLGYRSAAGGTGTINVRLESFFNSLVRTSDSFVQLGHGESTGNGDILVTNSFNFTDPFSFAALANRHVMFNASVQNSAAGPVNVVAGWDGVTNGFTSPVNFSDIVNTAGAFGNNMGTISIGDGTQNSGIAVGSRFEATNVAGYNLDLQGSNNSNDAFAQLGFQTNSAGTPNIDGAIDITLLNDLTATSGNSSNAYAQVGHGGFDFGGPAVTGDFQGDITIQQVNNVIFQGNGDNAYAQLGHGGLGASGDHSGNVTISAMGNLDLVGGAGNLAYAQIGHGDAANTTSGTRMGNIDVQVAGESSLVNGSGTDAPWLIGHRSTDVNAVSNASVTFVTNTLDDSTATTSTLSLLDQDFADIMSANLAGGTVTIGSTNTLQGSTGGMLVDGNFIYDSDNNLNLLSAADLRFNANVQNNGVGELNLVAGWDGVTGLVSPLVIGDFFNDTTTFGNNDGSVFIGDGTQTTGFAVGSRSGSTNVAAYNLNLQGSDSTANAYAQLGFHPMPAADIDGTITVGLTNDLSIVAGSADGSIGQLGHGGLATTGTRTGDIDVRAFGSASLLGSSAQSFALLGHRTDTANGIAADLLLAIDQLSPLADNGGTLTLNRFSQIDMGGAPNRVSIFDYRRQGSTFANGSMINGVTFNSNLLRATLVGNQWNQNIEFFAWDHEQWGGYSIANPGPYTSPFTFFYSAPAVDQQAFFSVLLNSDFDRFERYRQWAKTLGPLTSSDAFSISYGDDDEEERPMGEMTGSSSSGVFGGQ